MADAPARGRLTVHFGAAPGVGKTYAMLERAQALRRAGVDVVVGVALTHGRAETAALLAGLEVLPLRLAQDQGLSVGEFDAAAVLRRKPAVVVLDELAHSNAPGSRHAKRWQDTEDLLDAGIDVLTTLNVQHLESLREPVQRLTGIDVRERVPDAVIERTAAIELVDLPSDEVVARVRAGKVYLGDDAERALAGFFTPGNLAGLRELALRYVAGRVQARQDQDGVAPGRQPAERMLVAIGPSPTSARLIHAAKRMSDATGGAWLAVHAATPDTLHLDTEARRRIGEHLRLAERLGGGTLTVGGEDAVTVLVETARRHGVRRILVGKPGRTRLLDRWRGTLAYDLLCASGDIEVLAMSGEEAAEPTVGAALVHTAPAPRARWTWAIACLAIVLAIAIAVPLRVYLQPANLTLPFLLAVVGVALFGRRWPVIFTTIAGIAFFDLLCVPPYGSFAVSDAEYLLTFIGMLLVGMTIAHLVARLRRQADHALREAEGASALHRLGSRLATTRGSMQLVAAGAALAGDILRCRTVILVTDRDGSTSLSQEAIMRLADPEGALAPSDVAVAQWVAAHGRAAGIGTDTLPAAHGLHLPLLAGGQANGVLVCAGIDSQRVADPAWRRLAEAAARLIALALACERLHAQAGEERARAEREGLRATLLAGVSHDLRTPLTAIAGLAQQLADGNDPERSAIAQTIAGQAERLATTVRNLLELTRLGSGTVRPRRVALDAEDVLATAVAAVRPHSPGRTFTVVAQDCPPISADESLLHVALVNLLDNAVIHGAGSITITAAVAVDPGSVAIIIADQGSGVPVAERERIFDVWQRGVGARPGGAGLGLALVQAIIAAHGGSVAVHDHPGGGAAFTCTLPRHVDS